MGNPVKQLTASNPTKNFPKTNAYKHAKYDETIVIRIHDSVFLPTTHSGVGIIVCNLLEY
jgi:hypothetical protein